MRKITNNNIKKIIDKEYQKNLKVINKLKRCAKCILPETMPFISFDKKGVCNFCHSYQKYQPEGKRKLEQIVQPFRSNNGKPDCIVAFSGGRDSSFALHYLKTELNMNPIAYSYDWGMITNLAKHNQIKMVKKLKIQHVVIKANIRNKRINIRNNIKAWLKKPDLGTIPIFMAGDKQYFYYLQQLRKQTGINLVIVAENLFEKTNFKSGFCGVNQKPIQDKKFHALNLYNTFKLGFYYLKQFALNPLYFNSSIIDTIWAYLIYYFSSHDYLSFYQFINWDEKQIENVLINDYKWETDPETSTTWRIGDGTAAFYNYIYYTVAGFSENDTFRSNQIRANQIARSQALEIVRVENKPRLNSLLWYANKIGIDLFQTLTKINSINKRF